MSVLSSLNLEPGNIVGGYTLISRLGGGAMGSVWRVRDDGGNVYAMKILRDSLAEDEDTIEPQNSDDIDGASTNAASYSASQHASQDEPEAERNAVTARERLRREATSLRKIDHPGVCRIEDMELDDSLAFIVTELIEGNNLRQDVAINGKYIGQDLERLTAKLMEAVAAVHNAGIIHRDIKPTNVMVATTGPKLVDFGIAMGEGESHVTRTGLVMGTPGFIAPEIIDGAESDETTDWWSTAAVLAFAATGKPVFGSKPMMAVLERAASGHADLSGLPAQTAEAFRRALDPDPAKRCSPQDLLKSITEDAMHPELWEGAEAPAVPVVGKSAVLQQGGQQAGIPLPPPPHMPSPSTSDNPSYTGANAEHHAVMRPFGVNSSGKTPYTSAPPMPPAATGQNTKSALPTAAIQPDSWATPSYTREEILANPRLAWQRTPLPNLDILERQLSQSLPTMAVQQSTTVMPHASLGDTTVINAENIENPAHAENATTAQNAAENSDNYAYGSTTLMPNAHDYAGSQTTVINTPQHSINTPQPAPQTTVLHRQEAYAQPQFDDYNNSSPYSDAENYPEYPDQSHDDSDYGSNTYNNGELKPDSSSLDTSVDPARGKIILLALTLPLCLLAACAPAWSIIIGSLMLLGLAILGIARFAFIERVQRRGKRSSSDIPVAIGALPWHIIRAVAIAIPAALILVATFAVVTTVLTIILQLTTVRTHSIIFNLQVSMPLIVGAPASASGLVLAIGFAAGWLLATLTSYNTIFASGGAALRALGLTSTRPRTRLTLLAFWGIITLAAFATCLASSSFDWYPFASFIS